MKCISLWQPWATLLAIGAKRFETRSWRCGHRGPLAIHAAKTSPYDNYGIRAAIRADFEIWKEVLNGQCRIDSTNRRIDLDGLPRGQVIGVASMVDCVSTDTLLEVAQLYQVGELRCMAGKLMYEGHSDKAIELANKGHVLTPRERIFGNYSSGRFGFLMADAKPLERAFEFRGQQGLFEVPDNLFSL